jgi:multimeric flavodoxin WrbA
MKLKIFNASLKPSQASNTQVLIDLVTKNMSSLGVTVDTVHLKDLNFEHTTDNVKDDLTPHLIDIVENCDMISIATPIWWGVQSSLAQGLIERLDPIDSWGQDNDYYALYNKVFGTIVSGGGDGFNTSTVTCLVWLPIWE